MTDSHSSVLLSELRELGLSKYVNFTEDVHILLDQLLKILFEDTPSVTEKLNTLLFLELNTSLLLRDAADIELVIATFKNVFVASCCEKYQVLRGQLLISTTTILIGAFEKFSCGELDNLFSQHVNALLELVHQMNKANSVYVRSVAATCLTEIELCFPLLLKPCLDNIYSAAVAEISVAHQQLTSLLSLLMKHNLTNSDLGSPLWNKYPEVVLKSNFLGQKDVVSKSTIPGTNQLMSFLVDQLTLCTSEGVVWIANHIIDMLVHNPELQAYCQVLKPLFLNCVFTNNVAEFHLLLSLERAFGSELLGAQERSLFLKQMVLNCSHPQFSLSQRLIYLNFLDYYLFCAGHKLSSDDMSVILPNYFDVPEIYLRKFYLLSNLLRHSEGAPKVLLLLLTNMKNEITCKSNVKFKSAFVKALYKYFGDHGETSVEEISRLVLLTTMEDVTVTPFVLHFINEVQVADSESFLPVAIFTSLLSVYTQPDYTVTIKNFNFVVDIFQGAISQNSTHENVKSILMYLSKYVLNEYIFNMLPWRLGHKILKLCYSIMREYNTSDFFYELKDVLQAFVTKCENEDIQDRARFYQGLLVSLSNKKIKAVLQGPKQAVPHILSDERNFHPKTSFQTLEKPIVEVTKVHLSIPFLKKLDLSTIETENIVEVYKTFITSNAYVKQLLIPVCINMSADFHEISCVEALAIFVDTPEEWGKVDPIMIGHFRENELVQSENQLVEMVCHPSCPYPTEVKMRAEFSLDNMCHMSSLASLSIDFLDFFCPLPVFGDSHSTHSLFEEMWNCLEKEFYSVIALEKPEEFIKNLLKKHFDSFIVWKDAGDYDIAIYLPPGNHLLMKFCVKASKTVVKFVTDFNDILSFLTAFLHKHL